VTQTDGSGLLMVVGTPIGNLGDLSPRAVEALAGADILYCEDTRRTRGLLSHAGIGGASLRSLHAHNEDARIGEILDAVRRGLTVALVSDAGMPLVSDPGERVVAAAASAGLEVSVVPGPSAVTGALAVSGFPAGRFSFEGFLPRSGKSRRAALAVVAGDRRTVVLFEAPGRVAQTLADLAEVCGEDRPVAMVRELTKIHEQIWRGDLADAAVWARDAALRGEVVLVVGGSERDEPEIDDEAIATALSDRLQSGARTREVVDEVAARLGVSKRRVYDLALGLRDHGSPAD
jgi:16S rRNA (cytidine1402-2'-O)-methyltransferase